MPYANLPTGARVYYERQGEGPPLLLIMGTGLGHSCWNAQVEALSGRFECIYFDNRGTGKTEADEGTDTVSAMAEDTAALMQALDIERAHVSGLSLGSCIAQELALGWPELVTTLQLHGTWGRARGYAACKFAAQIRLLEELDLRAFYENNVLWFLTPEFMSRHPDRVADQIDAIVAAAPSKEDLIRQYRADLAHDALGRLHHIQVPTLVTVGSFDLAAPPMYGREVAEAIPDAEFVVFDGGGHLHNLERPEEFNGVALDFLARHG